MERTKIYKGIRDICSRIPNFEEKELDALLYEIEDEFTSLEYEKDKLETQLQDANDDRNAFEDDIRDLEESIEEKLTYISILERQIEENEKELSSLIGVADEFDMLKEQYEELLKEIQ